MHTFLVVVQVLVAVALIGLVLIQHGKGADAGAAFGSGASGTVFGARGAANFLSRATAWLAFVFFAVSLALAYWAGGRDTAPSSIVDTVPEGAGPAPAVPESGPTPPAGEQPAPPAPAVPE